MTYSRLRLNCNTKISAEEMQNCNFCKAILMLIIVLYHSGNFWTGDWFTVIEPAQTAKGIALFSPWLNTIHVFAFSLISGFVYYYVRYTRGSYTNYKQFVLNKTRRLIIPYFFVALFWVVPIYSYFYGFDVLKILNKYVLGEAPSQLWFVLMLFWVFVIAHPLSNFFINKPLSSALLVLLLWIIGICGSVLLPNPFQIFTSLHFIVYFWIGFELHHYINKYQRFKRIVFNKFTFASFLLLNVTLFLVIANNPLEGPVAKIVNITASLGAHIAGAIMSFILLMLIASSIHWQKPFFSSLTKASYPIYLFHQQIIYFVLWRLNGIVEPFILMVFAFVISTLVSWVISAVIASIPVLRPIIGLK